jgi:hypothetical protein
MKTRDALIARAIAAVERPLSFDEARRRYPHRFTMQHVPAWARQPCGNGRFYAPQYRSDAEWYARTLFPGEGDVSGSSKYCQSGEPSWPLGQWLDAPYRVGGAP